MKYMILLLLLMPMVIAEDIDLMARLDMQPTTKDPMLPECKAEWDRVMGEQPEEMVQRYCSAVGYRVLGLLILIALMWLLEPRLKRWSKENEGFEYVPYLYKWVGIGLIFMAGYAIYLVG